MNRRLLEFTCILRDWCLRYCSLPGLLLFLFESEREIAARLKLPLFWFLGFLFFSNEVCVALHVMNGEVVSQQEVVGAEQSPSKVFK